MSVDAREQTAHNRLSVDLEGSANNQFEVGATVEVETPAGRTFVQEMIPARGFQSSVEQELHFGVGAADTVTLTVTWPDQSQTTRPGVTTNQIITVSKADAQPAEPSPPSDPEPLLSAAAEEHNLPFSHRENPFVDYEQQPLLPHMLSREGPALAHADVTGNGREDVFIGGARGQPGALYVQRSDGTFAESSPSVFSAHRGYEDVDAVFFDADGDGDQDLYVVSGGKAARGAEGYQDRLYRNDGTGELTHAPEALPAIGSSGGSVAAHDYDGDGRVDLFVGRRVWLGEYPLPPQSYLSHLRTEEPRRSQVAEAVEELNAGRHVRLSGLRPRNRLDKLLLLRLGALDEGSVVPFEALVVDPRKPPGRRAAPRRGREAAGRSA